MTWSRSICQDGRFAVRSLIRRPGLFLASASMLGLAIGIKNGDRHLFSFRNIVSNS